MYYHCVATAVVIIVTTGPVRHTGMSMHCTMHTGGEFRACRVYYAEELGCFVPIEVSARWAAAAFLVSTMQVASIVF